jgi:hypothetical protein
VKDKPLFQALARPRRWFILVLWIVAYLFLIREFRIWTVEVYEGVLESTVASQMQEDSSDRTQPLIHNAQTAIDIQKQDQTHRVQIFAGQYLLLGIAGLILLSYKWTWTFILGSVHILASVINGISIWLYIGALWDLLFVSEALQQFIIPVLSLGLIPLAFWLDVSDQAG